jgi:hypothetical protein
MGGGISSCRVQSEIKCPKGYDRENFQKILSLYDKLDGDGNMVIGQDELYVLAFHHIKNQKELILREQKRSCVDLEANILMYKLKCENEKKALEQKYAENIKECKKKMAEEIVEYEERQIKIDLLTKEQKYAIFKDKFSGSTKNINFAAFFEYMRDKTDDIENINWNTKGCHLTPPKVVSVTINSPNSRPRILSP